MKIAATIAEYNPFHLGHEYMLSEVKRMGYDAAVAIMSGNFVQRGDCAIADKRARAKAALLCGADLVIELPLPYATATAQWFAFGAAQIIKSARCIDAIAFGSECGDIRLIKRTANLIDSDIGDKIKSYLAQGMPFAAAREKTVAEEDDKAAEILKNPNDTLAVEYVLQLKHSGIKSIAIKRVGSAHDGKAKDGYCSASEIRRLLLSGDKESAYRYMPKASAEIIKGEIEKGNAPANIYASENAVISSLRCMNVTELKSLPDISEGLENRILAAIREQTSLDGIAEAIKSKRYTMARIRRILLSAYLGTKSSDLCGEIPYIRVLGANETGRRVMGIMKNTSAIPVITKTKEINGLGKRAADLFLAECRSTDLYWLMTPKKQPCGKEMTDPVIMI